MSDAGVNSMEITLGPILWFWPKEQVLAFYEQVRHWPVERVYLGETVCARRREMKLSDWLAVGESLQEAGKEVVLSTQALVETEADLRLLRRICANGDFLVEANDQSALQLLIRAELPFVTGPSVNIYNTATLALLAEQGLQRWCLPPELSRETMTQILAESHEQGTPVPVEVFAWGYLPLAWSARCFTARHHGLRKDQCEFVCQGYPTGLALHSQEGGELFTLNGIQTLSGQRYNLLRVWPDMQERGVSAVRLSPEAEGMESVVRQFDQARQGALPPRDPLSLQPVEECNGYWYGQPGMSRVWEPG